MPPVELRRTVAAEPGIDDGLRRAAELLLAELDQASAELSLLLTDDAGIRSLNLRWRGKDSATDVLSFAQGGAGSEPVVGQAGAGELGDIVISLERAGEQARCGDWTLAEETNRLLLHGLLHLLGHEHEQGGEPAKLMRAEEHRLVARLAAAGVPCAGQELP